MTANRLPSTRVVVAAAVVGAIVLAQPVARLREDKTDRWSAGFLDAVEENYRLDRTFECSNANAVYLPR